jgi:hypothetical protein
MGYRSSVQLLHIEAEGIVRTASLTDGGQWPMAFESIRLSSVGAMQLFCMKKIDTGFVNTEESSEVEGALGGLLRTPSTGLETISLAGEDG